MSSSATARAFVASCTLDAAAATAASIESVPGVYNVVDDTPSPQRVWLPAFARPVRAPEPPHVTEQEALVTAGADAVYYATRPRGASNEKAKRALHLRPRRWSGYPAVEIPEHWDNCTEVAGDHKTA